MRRTTCLLAVLVGSCGSTPGPDPGDDVVVIEPRATKDTRPKFIPPRPEDAYRPSVTENDLRALDPWGDGGGDASDLVALYSRIEADTLHVGVDILDVRADARPSVSLALDLGPGGVRWLTPGGVAVTVVAWDLLVVVRADGTAIVFTPDGNEHPNAIASAAVDATLDRIAVDLARAMMPTALPTTFQIETLLVDTTSGAVVDRIAPAASDARPSGRGHLAIHFGNLLGAATPAGVASWYERRERDPKDGVDKPFGWRYLLDAAGHYFLPIAIDVKQAQYVGWTNDLGLYERIDALHAAGLLDTPDTLGYGHFMAWQPQDVDGKAIALGRELSARAGLPSSRVFMPYEGELTVADLATIGGSYDAVLAGTDGDYPRWFDTAPGSAFVRQAGKVNRVNGVGLIFHRPPWSFEWDARWGPDPYAGWNEADLWRGTDGGIHPYFRRVLLDFAMDADQEQFVSLGTDMQITTWGFAEVVDANMRWLAEHPWIKVIHHDGVIDRGWAVVDHGDLGLPPATLLPRLPIENDGHYNAYFPQYYDGGTADGHSPFVSAGQHIEGYADYVPYLRDGLPIPSGRRMGDDATPGTIVHDTLAGLRAAPDNGLRTLAWLSYFAAIGEQTLHTSIDARPGDPRLDTGFPVGGAFLHPAAKVRANCLRHTGKITAAASWAAAVEGGDVAPRVEAVDLDLDGEDETVLRNGRLYLVFENEGGRLEYGFAYFPGRGAVQIVAPHEQFTAGILRGGSSWDWTRGEAGQAPIAPDVGWVGAFVEWDEAGRDRAYEPYSVERGSDQVTFTSPDARIRKTFAFSSDGGSITVAYETADEVTVEVTAALDPLRMWTRDFSQTMGEVETPGRVGIGFTDGLMVLLSASGDATLRPEVSSFLDSPARWEWRHDEGRDYEAGHWSLYPLADMRVTGKGTFTLRLEPRG